MKVFEELYVLYKCDIYNFLYKLTGYHADIAEELSQETFYQAFLSFERFRGDCEIKTWLCQIAKHTYYRYIRSEVKHHNILNKLKTDDKKMDFTLEIEREEVIQFIHLILSEFDQRTKDIFEYRLFGTMKYSEIAKLLDIKEATAKVIFCRTKVKIKQRLKEDFDYEI